MKKYIIVFMLLIKCFSIKTMDKQPYITPEAIINHSDKVITLCNLTSTFLHHISLPHSNQEHIVDCLQDLVHIKDQMDCLKQTQPPITEKMIGHFAKQTSFSLSLIETASLKKPFAHIVKDPSYISLFFARLANYNNHLLKNSSLLSPNIEQIKNHLANEELQRIITQNALRNVIIPQEVIDAKTILIPSNIATGLFMDFVKDIQDIIKTCLIDVKKSVELIYYNELKNQNSSNS